METTGIERYLKSFAAKVVSQSKGILHSAKGDTFLGNSIRYEVKKDPNGYSTEFYMQDYGTYLDEGVSGNKKQQSFIDTEGKKKISQYKYTTKGPPIDIISKWIKKKGIQPKGLGRGRSKKTGQFVSGFAFLISRKIKREGIKSISFFSKTIGHRIKKITTRFFK